MNSTRYKCLVLAASWCNPEDGLDYKEYVDQIRRSIDKGFIDANCFVEAFGYALNESNFGWLELLIKSKAVNPDYFPEIVENDLSAKQYLIEYFLPVYEGLKNRNP